MTRVNKKDGLSRQRLTRRLSGTKFGRISLEEVKYSLLFPPPHRFSRTIDKRESLSNLPAESELVARLGRSRTTLSEPLLRLPRSQQLVSRQLVRTISKYGRATYRLCFSRSFAVQMKGKQRDPVTTLQRRLRMIISMIISIPRTIIVDNDVQER